MFLLFHGDNFWSCASIHDMDFGKKFLKIFLKSHFSSQFQVVYITMTCAYIENKLRITKSIN